MGDKAGMAKVRITRSVEVPDALRVSRYRKHPELGPRILFFSGGTAINSLCKTLKDYTHNSIHLVTPFDSGGSSAKLRQAFAMPAIGDLRSRLMALADESVLGHPEVYRLFTHRFDAGAGNRTLRVRLDDMVEGRESLVADVPNPMRQLIRNQLGFFRDAMPRDFDLRGASVGNLILAGGYLNNRRELDPIIFLFSKLVNVQGTVRAVVDEDLHLGVDLVDGRQVIGQHCITGKEMAPLDAPIRRLFLSQCTERAQEVRPRLRKRNRRLIADADLICYPPGSFFSSVLANLLPAGVGRAVAANDCPKVYVPNLGDDPEQLGLSLPDSVGRLLQQLRSDLGGECRSQRLLNFVLLDSSQGDCTPDQRDALQRDHGVTVIDMKLVSRRSAPYYDRELLVSALLSLT